MGSFAGDPDGEDSIEQFLRLMRAHVSAAPAQQADRGAVEQSAASIARSNEAKALLSKWARPWPNGCRRHDADRLRDANSDRRPFGLI